MVEEPRPGEGIMNPDPRIGLWPENDSERWEALVRSIMAEASPVLEKQREASSVVAAIGRWQWPAVPLATAVAAGVILMSSSRQHATPWNETLVEVMLPTPIAAWVVDDYEMEPHELIAALGQVTP